MRSAYLVVPVLCMAPLLPGCASFTSTLASYGVKSMLDVRHSRETPEMYYDLGRYYQAQMRWDRAAGAYERALALRADYIEAANGLATSYAMSGRSELAIARLKDAIAQAPNAAYLYNNLGYIYYLTGRYSEAIGALENATRLEPENRRAWRNLGLAYGKAGEPDKSRNAYGRATPRALLENWRASHPFPAAAASASGDSRAAVAAGTQFASVPDPIHGARPPGSVQGTAISANAGRTSPSLELVPLQANIYELRPISPAALPATVTTVSAADASQPPKLVPLKPFRVEVSNGNGTAGMARRISDRLKHLGMDTARLTNQKPWQPGSEIQFREGYALEAAKLAGLLNHELLTVRNDELRGDIQVRLVLGKDVRNETAFVAPDVAHGSTRVARSE
jgi:Tfp pilus assembly protein PilF